MARIVSPGPSDLTKKRATFGPCAHRRRRAAAVASNPHICWRLRYFSLGAIPPRRRSASIAPEPRPLERGRERLNSLGFSVQPHLCRAGDKFARDYDPEETAGHHTSSRRTMADEWRGCAQLIVRRRRRPDGVSALGEEMGP